MSSKDSLDIQFHANGQVAGNETVDAWEPKAARRALKTLKTLLPGKAMLDLIQTQIDASDAYYKRIVAASNGEYRECRVDLKVNGISVAELMKFRKIMMQNMDAQSHHERDAMALDSILSIHPEHYALPPYPEGIVEVIGEHMARLRIIVTPDVPAFVMAYGTPDYPMKKPTVGQLDDGTVLFYILHEFRDTETGCDIILRLLFPPAALQVFFDDHAEHLSIEFRRGLQAAFEERAQS